MTAKPKNLCSQHFIVCNSSLKLHKTILLCGINVVSNVVTIFCLILSSVVALLTHAKTNVPLRNKFSNFPVNDVAM